MTIEEFDNGYWYATELKAFAHAIGIPGASGLRKDQLESALRSVLSGERAPIIAAAPPSAAKDVARDTARPLAMTRRIVRYTNDRATKDFLQRQARKLAPDVRFRSGARYRLNRWREERIAAGAAITYGVLVREYVRLCRSDEPFARMPHGRYVNFVSDFYAHRPTATRKEIIAAWHELKTMDCPKTFRDWQKRRSSRASRGRG
jgi:hypothetical protein